MSYANPTLAGGAPCPGGRAGFDIHPSFNADPARLANVANFMQSEFLPQLKALAICQSGILCRDPAGDRFTFVDAHQAAFANHGYCARSESDPDFDRMCFSSKGDSFDPDIVTAANQPMVCGRSASEYRAYLPRARWIRDANDSYFAAMTYPQGLPSSMQPSDIHDATWGILSAVYGGAIHPSAEGHAAMADAALPAAASVLRLDAAVGDVTSEPVAPLQQYRLIGEIAELSLKLDQFELEQVARARPPGLFEAVPGSVRGRHALLGPSRRSARARGGRLRRQIFRDNRRIELRDVGIRQPLPGLVATEQRKADIAAHGQFLAVGADGHLGMIDLAIARIEHVAVLVLQSPAARFMSRIKEMPCTGAFLRSSVHFEQMSLVSSPGSGNSLAITPSKLVPS